jgi:hypothetical protein
VSRLSQLRTPEEVPIAPLSQGGMAKIDHGQKIFSGKAIMQVS